MKAEPIRDARDFPRTRLEPSSHGWRLNWPTCPAVQDNLHYTKTTVWNCGNRSHNSATPLVVGQFKFDPTIFNIDPSKLLFILSNLGHTVIDGDRSAAQVKLLCALRRRSGTSAEEFHTHWRNVHGPIFRDTPALADRILAYDQSPRLTKDYERDAGGGVDGVAEQYYRSIEDFGAMFGAPEYQSQVVPDEDKLMDRSQLDFILCSPPDVIL